VNERIHRENRFAAAKFDAPGLCCFGAWIVLAIFSSRCLYADGAHEFIRVLQAQDFVSLIWSRCLRFTSTNFCCSSHQAGRDEHEFFALCLWAGLFSSVAGGLAVLSLDFTEHFWVAIMGCAAGYLNACYMAIGEHILAHASTGLPFL